MNAGKLLNVLVVDDDDICLFISKKLAEKSGCFGEIRCATDGTVALKIIEEVINGNVECPDLILLDLHMPTIDGWAFMKAFNALEWKNKHRVSVVALTSSDSSCDRQRAKALGMEHFIQKPLTPETLASVVLSKVDVDSFEGHAIDSRPASSANRKTASGQPGSDHSLRGLSCP